MNTNRFMQLSCRTLAALAFLIPALSQAADEAASCKYLVGANLLLRTDLEVSLADKSLRFFGPVKREDCANTHLAYWDRNAMAIPFKGSPYQKSVFTVTLNGVELVAQIDTGAERSSVSRDAAKRAGIPFDTPGLKHGDKLRGLSGEALDTRLATFDSFAIGDETIGHADLAIADDSPHGSNTLDMRLGLDFLRSHRVLFAMSQKRLYFSYLGGDVFTPHARQTKDKP